MGENRNSGDCVRHQRPETGDVDGEEMLENISNERM